MPTPRTTTEILDYHRRAVEALRLLSRAFDTLDAKAKALFPRTKEAFLDVLDDMRNELDDEVVLALVASAERSLRLDFRALLGEGDAPAVRFGHLNERYDGHVPLESALDVWKELTAEPEKVGRFKQLYVYRHGLAHGRFFNKSGVHHVTPEDVGEVIRELFAAICLYTTDFPRG
jgi:hypothetical protein